MGTECQQNWLQMSWGLYRWFRKAFSSFWCRLLRARLSISFSPGISRLYLAGAGIKCLPISCRSFSSSEIILFQRVRQQRKVFSISSAWASLGQSRNFCVQISILAQLLSQLLQQAAKNSYSLSVSCGSCFHFVQNLCHLPHQCQAVLPQFLLSCQGCLPFGNGVPLRRAFFPSDQRKVPRSVAYGGLLYRRRGASCG